MWDRDRRRVVRTFVLLVAAVGLAASSGWAQEEDPERQRAELRKRYRSAATAQERRAILEEMKRMEVRRRPFAADHPEALYVQQRHALTGQYDPRREGSPRFLQTHNASGCTIVSLYDPATKRGVLAHFDQSVDVARGLEMMLESLGAESGVQARVIGGWKGVVPSGATFAAIVDHLVRREGVDVVEREIGRQGTPEDPGTSFSVQLDLADGTLHDYVETDPAGANRPGRDVQVPLPPKAGG